MFKRLTTSLSQPKKVFFFMKDSWFRVIVYALLIPLLLSIPFFLTMTTANGPRMSAVRYDLLKTAIQDDFRVQGAKIIDGVLTYERTQSASFDLFTLYIGESEQNKQTINFVFSKNYLVTYINETKIDQISYSDLNLENHDFSSTDAAEIMELAVALRVFIEGQSVVIWTDFAVAYLFNLTEYLLVGGLMGLLMLLFISRIKIPYKYRIKMSIFLTSIWVFSELALTLFGAKELGFISIFAVYIYHIIFYRSLNIKKTGVNNGK